jgi:hypothetical protein
VCGAAVYTAAEAKAADGLATVWGSVPAGPAEV